MDRGIRTGRLQVDDRAVALTAAGGALLSVVRSVLQGRGRPETAEHHAACILRMFGLGAVEAAEVAARPLPAVVLEREDA